ncbi:exo-alpha-sialidase [Luteitalea sp.]|uniref:sialidase family protein n=1 Tax=Luteitalea sp. TaxID=2004800 RepID=UPI0025C3B450|nr:sialidase family protein [Luteitalea sp.]
MPRRGLLSVGALLVGAWAGMDAAGDLTSEALFVEARGQVHASSIVETPRGALLVAWYENGDPTGTGPFEGQDLDKRQDVRISGARRAPGATQWSRPFVLADTADLPDNNPALGIDSGGRLWLIHATLLGVPEKAWGSALTRALVSTDFERDGTPRWDASHTIVPKPPGFTSAVAQAAEQVRIGPGRTTEVAARANRMLATTADPYARHLGWMPRTHPLVLADGTLLVPLANENVNMAAMALAHDGGARWTFSAAVPTAGVIQPSVIRLPDGTLQAYFRDARGTGRVARSTSTDQGRTWSAATPTDLPNPSGGIEAIVLRSGAVAVVHNDQTGRERDRLSIALSTDGGRTWPVRKVIVHVAGERFDYPSVIQARDGRVHVTFSDNLKTIRHVSFPEAWVSTP